MISWTETVAYGINLPVTTYEIPVPDHLVEPLSEWLEENPDDGAEEWGDRMWAFLEQEAKEHADGQEA